jgi:hypothetical protein
MVTPGQERSGNIEISGVYGATSTFVSSWMLLFGSAALRSNSWAVACQDALAVASGERSAMEGRAIKKGRRLIDNSMSIELRPFFFVGS